MKTDPQEETEKKNNVSAKRALTKSELYWCKTRLNDIKSKN